MLLDPTYPEHTPFDKIGYIPIPLSTLREMTTSAVPNTAGDAGVLSSNTTPIFMPPNFDNSVDLKLKILAEMSGSTPWDTCTVAADTFFDVADTKVEDSVAITGGTVVEWTLTIAAADIPFGAKTVSIELTPGAHANDALYVTTMEFHKIDNKSVDGPFAKTGFLPVPLVQLRKVSSNDIVADMQMNNALVTHEIPLPTLLETDGTYVSRVLGQEKVTVDFPLTSWREDDGAQDIPAIHDTPLTADPDGFGGLLAKNTTPILEATNVDTDTALRLNWATSNVDSIHNKIQLPANLDTSRDMTFRMRGLCADGNVNDLDIFFDEGDTKVSDAFAVLTGSVTDVAATVAASDIPSGARSMTVEITPAAHGSNPQYVYGISLDYYVTTGPGLTIANGDTDGQMAITWAASNSDPLHFSAVLPRDLDTSLDMTLYVRAESGGSTDVTNTIALDTYFNEGDTKVSDATNAITDEVLNATATIAAADIPAGAQVVSIELTPGAHTTDSLIVYGVWLEYRLSSADPALGYTNGDTDSSHRLRWAATEVSPVSFSVVLPPDVDTNNPIYLKVWAVMGGASDDPVIAVDSYFNIGDTKVEDNFEAIDNVAAEYQATIAAADIPDVARVLSCELTPGAHGSDTLDIHALWVEYTKL
jgi:hypothetical protein